MVVAKKFVLVKHFEGPPKESDFQLIEEELLPLKDGEFLAQAIYLSVDPYMRAYAHDIPLGSTMIGSQVAKIIESKNEKYPINKHVVAKFDWRTHTISSGETGPQGPPMLLPDFGSLPLSYALGVLGMPGVTAYLGFFDICTPKPGQTVVVSGAAGAVGSIVGQMAKIKECKVIGIAGSDEKGNFLVQHFGFDAFINYKTADVDRKLSQLAPEGVDCYFDNVAGAISSIVINHMNEFGRVAVVGSISSYNSDINNLPKVPVIQHDIATKSLVMEGLQVRLHRHRFPETISQNLKWMQEGKLKYHETITEGFENTVKAFKEMLQGKNLGKAVVKV